MNDRDIAQKAYREILKENPRKAGSIFISCILEQGDEIEELEAEIGRLKGHWEEAEGRVILAASQNYCTICGNTLDGYIPPREHEEDLK